MLRPALLGIALILSTSAATAAPTERAPITDELMRMRDPFKRPKAPKKGGDEVVTLLETIPVSAFKMLGVVTGPDRVRAMLADGQGRTHFVAENMRIGTRKGRIIRISPEKVVVRERIPNVLGVIEDIDTVLSLPSDRKIGATGSAFNQENKR